MKKHNSIYVALLLTLISFQSTAQTFSYPTKDVKGLSIVAETKGNIEFDYNLGSFSFNNLNYKGEDMSEITISAITLPNNPGCPNLPTESRFIAIPQGAKATLNVVSYETEIIRNVISCGLMTVVFMLITKLCAPTSWASFICCAIVDAAIGSMIHGFVSFNKCERQQLFNRVIQKMHRRHN